MVTIYDSIAYHNNAIIVMKDCQGENYARKKYKEVSKKA